MNRRTCLAAVAGVLGTVPGCLGGRDPGEDGASPTTAERATVAVSTPEPGDCSALSPPAPDTGEGLPSARPYPEGPPTVSEAAVRSFAESYESTHRYNRVLADVAAGDDCVRDLSVRVTDATATAAGEGVRAAVTTRASYTGTTCPGVSGSDTPTPLPHVDAGAETARYYVTDRFAVRGFATVECW